MNIRPRADSHKKTEPNTVGASQRAPVAKQLYWVLRANIETKKP